MVDVPDLLMRAYERERLGDAAISRDAGEYAGETTGSDREPQVKAG
ncbi:hypothetical protein Psuf_040140 [Phytohabitans suffuscus]|uniref:Uncharacterized protein n=1 Tax=Phytohabitans suffuscus TaxID=624315 RepID=A0A6F8YL82_9ACTN|nr:hypothetical protein Psuf_040140 [Phytohabitans suffuscus]